MKWQEYQEAVGQLYAQIDDIGVVHKNITLPDKITGQSRQIDVWIDIEAKSHKIGILVDAKFRKEKLDVKDIEEVNALALAVGANKAIIVATNGWTDPAQNKAKFIGMDLRVLTLEEALEILVPEKWILCPLCQEDCIVMETSGGLIVNGILSLLVAGRCRECQCALGWCWECGERFILEDGDVFQCPCGHDWKYSQRELCIRQSDDDQFIVVLDAINKNNVLAVQITDIEDEIDSLIGKGITFREQGSYEKSLDYLNRAIRHKPNCAEILLQRALTFDASQSYDKALFDYNKAIELDADLVYAYGSRGILHLALGNWEQCIWDLEKYLSLDPSLSRSDHYGIIKTLVKSCNIVP